MHTVQRIQPVSENWVTLGEMQRGELDRIPGRRERVRLDEIG